MIALLDFVRKMASSPAPASTSAPAKRKADPEVQAPDKDAAEIAPKTNSEGEVVFELGSKLLRVSVTSFKGKAGVDIRRFYSDKSGDILPTAKGVRLSVSEWESLCKEFARLDAQT